VVIVILVKVTVRKGLVGCLQQVHAAKFDPVRSWLTSCSHHSFPAVFDGLTMSLQASVVDHEDVTNAAGEILTKYIVQVKYLNATYTIAKRYSEFKTLYDILKDLVPMEYKFPNKSMFHNSAQATKERRIRGFDELLQILLSRNPVPTVMERFLGVNERKTKSLQIRSKSINLNKTGDGQNGSHQHSATDDNMRRSTESDPPGMNEPRYTEPIVVIPEPQYSSSGSREVTYSPEKFELIRTLRREAPNIIMSSMKGTSGVYIVLVIVRVIDISNSDFSEILLTMCILSFVVSFVRINMLKYQPRSVKTVADGNALDNSSAGGTQSSAASAIMAVAGGDVVAGLTISKTLT
jgi:hypothetical protein